MPLVSVIIINYNGRKYLSGCLDSLNRGTFRDFELIIVDNGSSDGSLELIKEKFPEVKLLELGENLGLSIASNRGRFMARGKYLFFLDNLPMLYTYQKFNLTPTEQSGNSLKLQLELAVHYW